MRTTNQRNCNTPVTSCLGFFSCPPACPFRLYSALCVSNSLSCPPRSRLPRPWPCKRRRLAVASTCLRLARLPASQPHSQQGGVLVSHSVQKSVGDSTWPLITPPSHAPFAPRGWTLGSWSALSCTTKPTPVFSSLINSGHSPLWTTAGLPFSSSHRLGKRVEAGLRPLWSSCKRKRQHAGCARREKVQARLSCQRAVSFNGAVSISPSDREGRRAEGV